MFTPAHESWVKNAKPASNQTDFLITCNMRCRLQDDLLIVSSFDFVVKILDGFVIGDRKEHAAVDEIAPRKDSIGRLLLLLVLINRIVKFYRIVRRQTLDFSVRWQHQMHFINLLRGIVKVDGIGALGRWKCGLIVHFENMWSDQPAFPGPDSGGTADLESRHQGFLGIFPLRCLNQSY